MERPSSKSTDITIVGGGMYVKEVLLPSIYHLQRLGEIGQISVCTRSAGTVQSVRDDALLRQAFPGQSFRPFPSYDAPDEYPELYKEAIQSQASDGTIVVSLPDHMHHEAIMTALDARQHVLSVKPLTQRYNDTLEIANAAHERGLFVGTEYHKRHDRRSLVARKRYEEGQFGNFVTGDARMIEPYNYRLSNFQNWFTPENADPFTYVGCHYVDLVHFITRLRVSGISVKGWKGRFPNGNEGYMWTNSRVEYENGGTLSMINGLGYPDDGAGSNDQGLTMFFEREGETTMLKHNDQFRGCTHSYASGNSAGRRKFQFVNPDFFQLVPWEEEGLRPTGYGYDSVASIILMINRMRAMTLDMEDTEEVMRIRQHLIEEVDAKGFLATPRNTAEHELVAEAARLSLENNGLPVEITYDENPTAKLK